MNSEKVKEINAKEALEILVYKYKDVESWEIAKPQLMDILTLINELEEQRDRQAYIAEELIQKKHRWTEQVRKETAKQFVERLKRKVTIRHEFIGDFSILVNTMEYLKVEDIDETLKEFLKKEVEE